MTKPKDELIRLSLNMPDELLKRVQHYADGLNINRTAAINVLLNYGLMSVESMDMLKLMAGKLKDDEGSGRV